MCVCTLVRVCVLKQMEMAVSGERQRDIPAGSGGGEKVVEALR